MYTLCVNRFLLSGADVITTATYQASIPGFISHLEVSAERARELLMSGVHLAKETVKRFESGRRAYAELSRADSCCKL